jgi:peptidoglycan hydrolase CwlO-like protein
LPQGHLEAASTDETIGQLQRMRENDAERIAKLNADRADLGAALKAAEARIAFEAAAAQRAAKEAGQRQYALQTQVRCRCHGC